MASRRRSWQDAGCGCLGGACGLRLRSIQASSISARVPGRCGACRSCGPIRQRVCGCCRGLRLGRPWPGSTESGTAAWRCCGSIFRQSGRRWQRPCSSAAGSRCRGRSRSNFWSPARFTSCRSQDCTSAFCHWRSSRCFACSPCPAAGRWCPWSAAPGSTWWSCGRRRLSCGRRC